MNIGRSAPQHQEISFLYPNSRKLQIYLQEYFIVVINLCKELVSFATSSKLDQFKTSIEGLKLKHLESELERQSQAIKDEVDHHMAVTVTKEAKHNSNFRSQMQRHLSSHDAQIKLRFQFDLLNRVSRYDGNETTWKQLRKIGKMTLLNSLGLYNDWLTSESANTLVLTGKLGAGKSVIMANVVDDLCHKLPC